MNIQNSSKVTAEDIRHFIFDRTVGDNVLSMDLGFSDDEILRAMRYCAMSFNSIPPYVYEVDPSSLPNEAWVIHGTIYHLFLSKLSMLTRNDFDQTSGNMTIDLAKRQIAHLEKQIPFHKAEFETDAKQRKVFTNISQAFRRF